MPETSVVTTERIHEPAISEDSNSRQKNAVVFLDNSIIAGAADITSLQNTAELPPKNIIALSLDESAIAPVTVSTSILSGKLSGSTTGSVTNKSLNELEKHELLISEPIISVEKMVVDCHATHGCESGATLFLGEKSDSGQHDDLADSKEYVDSGILATNKRDEQYINCSNREMPVASSIKKTTLLENVELTKETYKDVGSATAAERLLTGGGLATSQSNNTLAPRMKIETSRALTENTSISGNQYNMEGQPAVRRQSRIEGTLSTDTLTRKDNDKVSPDFGAKEPIEISDIHYLEERVDHPEKSKQHSLVKEPKPGLARNADFDGAVEQEQDSIVERTTVKRQPSFAWSTTPSIQPIQVSHTGKEDPPISVAKQEILFEMPTELELSTQPQPIDIKPNEGLPTKIEKHLESLIENSGAGAENHNVNSSKPADVGHSLNRVFDPKRRSSIILNSGNLSIDNALGFRVCRLEDLIVDVNEKVRSMKVSDEKQTKMVNVDGSVENCTKEEMNQLACRLSKIEQLLHALINDRAVPSEPETLALEMKGEKSETKTSHDDATVHIPSDSTPYHNVDSSLTEFATTTRGSDAKMIIGCPAAGNHSDVMPATPVGYITEATTTVSEKETLASEDGQTNGNGSNSLPAEDGWKDSATMTAESLMIKYNDDKTKDFIERLDFQKILASQEENFEEKFLSLSAQILELKQQLFEQKKKTLIQDIISSSGTQEAVATITSAATIDDIYSRLGGIDVSLLAVQDKTSMKVSLSEVCDLISLLTEEGKVDHIDNDVAIEVAARALTSFQRNSKKAIEILHQKKADKIDIELDLRRVEDKVCRIAEDLIQKTSSQSEQSQKKLEKAIDDCRSLIDIFDAKLQLVSSASNLERSNSVFDSQIEAKIKESMNAVHASLEEVVAKKLEDIRALENELERLTSQLAEKPDEKQLRAMFHDLEQALADRIANGTTLQALLNNIRIEVMEKMTKVEVLQLVREMVQNAKNDAQSNEDSLMIGTSQFRCLGCDKMFSRGVHNKLADKKNHQALPSSGYLKRTNLYLDSSHVESCNSGHEAVVNLPPMHNGAGCRRPYTNGNLGKKLRRGNSSDHHEAEQAGGTRLNNNKLLH